MDSKNVWSRPSFSGAFSAPSTSASAGLQPENQREGVSKAYLPLIWVTWTIQHAGQKVVTAAKLQTMSDAQNMPNVAIAGNKDEAFEMKETNVVADVVNIALWQQQCRNEHCLVAAMYRTKYVVSSSVVVAARCSSRRGEAHLGGDAECAVEAALQVGLILGVGPLVAEDENIVDAHPQQNEHRDDDEDAHVGLPAGSARRRG